MLNVGLHCVGLTWFADNIFVYRDPDPTSLFVLHGPVSEHFWTSTCTKCFFIFFLNDGSKKYIKNLLWARIACSNQIIFYPSIPVRYRTYYSNLNVKICKPCRFWASYVVWIRFTRPTLPMLMMPMSHYVCVFSPAVDPSRSISVILDLDILFIKGSQVFRDFFSVLPSRNY